VGGERRQIRERKQVKNWTIPALTLALAMGGCSTVQPPAPPLARLAKVAQVDERFQSYNVEMVEVTGGRFWAPYGGPEGEVYRMRPPADLSDPRLRLLATELGPAYMRVSGTWANSTYLEADGERLAKPPPGYNQVLTRDQWRGVVDFAKAVDAKITVSFAVSEGARDADGVWTTSQAQRLIDLTREAGGSIAAAEFINEPNAASFGNLPEDYSVADYTRDFAIFRGWAERAAPGMLIVGPGGVGEGAGMDNIPVAMLDRLLLTEELMEASPGAVDVVSYHFYGDVSQRCADRRPTTADRSAALTPQWLDLTLRDWRYYGALRDKQEPGDPLWVTETAQAACGGSPWAASFVDTFRYVNQLGLLAQKGVQAVFHNTLSASDYSLIDEHTMTPRPNYWAAVLWRRVMGSTVLESPAAPSPDLRLYAHCLRGQPGGVALAAINLGDTAQTVHSGRGARAWVIQAADLDSQAVTISNEAPGLGNGGLTGLSGQPVDGPLAIPGKSIAFVAVPGAANPACR
jgi:heparanase